MSFTRNFPTHNDNLDIDARIGDLSHPVLASTTIPDFYAFTRPEQIEDLFYAYGAAADRIRLGTPQLTDLALVEVTTPINLCHAVNSITAERRTTALRVMHLARYNSFRPAVVDLATNACTLWASTEYINDPSEAKEA